MRGVLFILPDKWEVVILVLFSHGEEECLILCGNCFFKLFCLFAALQEALSAVITIKLLSCCQLPETCSRALWLIAPQIISAVVVRKPNTHTRTHTEFNAVRIHTHKSTTLLLHIYTVL